MFKFDESPILVSGKLYTTSIKLQMERTLTKHSVEK